MSSINCVDTWFGISSRKFSEKFALSVGAELYNFLQISLFESNYNGQFVKFTENLNPEVSNYFKEKDFSDSTWKSYFECVEKVKETLGQKF